MTGQTRGWLALTASSADVQQSEPLIIIQHPRDLSVDWQARFLPIQFAIGNVLGFAGGEKWLRNFGQWDKWIVCLTTGTVVPANQEKS